MQSSPLPGLSLRPQCPRPDPVSLLNSKGQTAPGRNLPPDQDNHGYYSSKRPRQHQRSDRARDQRKLRRYVVRLLATARRELLAAWQKSGRKAELPLIEAIRPMAPGFSCTLSCLRDYSTFTLISFFLASSVLGSRISNPPSLKTACAFSRRRVGNS